MQIQTTDNRLSPSSNTTRFFSRLIMSTSLERNRLGGVAGIDADASFFVVVWKR